MITSAVLPVRLESKRFPRKALFDIQGKPLIWYVWNNVNKVECIDELFVTTDSDEIRDVVNGWGGKVLMSSPDCNCGTERIASCLQDLEGDFILNVQADIPVLDCALLDQLIEEGSRGLSWDVITPVYRITQDAELWDHNLVKVIRTSSGKALYFSRSTIPFVRDLAKERWLEESFWGHIGIYGYKRDALRAYSSLPTSDLERKEKLEQLRFIDAGYHVQTIATEYRSISIDSPKDIEKMKMSL